MNMMPNTNTVQLPTCVKISILRCCNDFEPFYGKLTRNMSVLAYADLMIVWSLFCHYLTNGHTTPKAPW